MADPTSFRLQSAWHLVRFPRTQARVSEPYYATSGRGFHLPASGSDRTRVLAAFFAGSAATPSASNRRRAAAAGIMAPIGNHTFRATGITAYLGNGGTLEHAQSMAAHESPRTTKLYDRTQDRLTQDEVERIRL